ncbi:MAG: ribosomal protein S18-alanine N-acetyltransferase [Kangiellaceae bacterium]|nr:ribosomal protein S18-alanine N-acetyltransferase [Kangiellaceae bacterium]MCW8998947.1 ribosomal protein S18-alanine N-acetyltransferase [Kangiellaceae bacterium]
MQDLTIRIVNQHDLCEILNIERRVHNNPWSSETITQSIDRLSGKKQAGQVQKDGFVALRNQKVVGYLFYSKVFEEIELTNIAVDFDYQGQSIGGQLLKQLVDFAYATQSLHIFLEVRASNTGAITLYQNVGFIQTSLRKNYYPTQRGREDAVLMTLQLSQIQQG